MGRENTPFETVSKTFMLFKADVEEAKKNGWSAKEVFRAGVITRAGRSEQVDRLKELEARTVKQERGLAFLHKRVEILQDLFGDVLNPPEDGKK
jgi:hypothetical protein